MCLRPDYFQSLYVEQIDLGEESGPRTIVSGLAKYIPLEELRNRKVLVLANLKPASLRGIRSQGMLLAAANAENTQVEILEPPENASLGEHVTFEGFPYEPMAQLNPKKDVFKKCAVDMKVSEGLVAMYKDVPFRTSAGEVKVKSLKGATIG